MNPNQISNILSIMIGTLQSIENVYPNSLDEKALAILKDLQSSPSGLQVLSFLISLLGKL